MSEREIEKEKEKMNEEKKGGRERMRSIICLLFYSCKCKFKRIRV